MKSFEEKKKEEIESRTLTELGKKKMQLLWI